VAALRITLVSDTHLSPAAPEAEANWDAVLGHVAQTAPDVVIHLGDLSLDGAHDPGDLQHGRRQLDRLPVPWHAVPGNHDIGDNPWPGAPEDYLVNAARRQRWLDIVGADHWSLTVNGWTLLAINAQLPGSGLEAEARQWSWLDEQLSAAGKNQRLALLTHKPVTATDAELASSPAYRFLPRPARDRLAGLFGDTPPALVLSGHVHQYRLLRLGDTDHLWVPTTWAVLPDQAQPVLGAKRCGIVSLDLTSDGASEPVLVEPDGIAQLTVGGNIPNPYHR
jgi:3',5'-cyclic AMP phosphodiesterase CpdA